MMIKWFHDSWNILNNRNRGVETTDQIAIFIWEKLATCRICWEEMWFCGREDASCGVENAMF